MIIFLYGSDSYRLKENFDTIVSIYLKKHKNRMGYYCFDFGSQGKFNDLANAVQNISFFDEVKLIIIKNPFFSDSQTTINKFNELVGEFKLSEDKKTILVFIENKSETDLQKINKNLFVLLSGKNNLVRNFEYLRGVKLSNWIRNKFKENGRSVSLAVADLLISAVGNESWALANEVNKLSNYHTSRSKASGGRGSAFGNITEKDISLLVSHKENNSIFDLVDAVGNQNKAKAFEMMYRLINSGHDSYYLLSMIIYHFENLLSVSDLFSRSQASGGVVAQKCGLHPFVAQKVISQIRKFKKEDLFKKFNKLAELDVISKNGQVNLEDSLYNFLFL